MRDMLSSFSLGNQLILPLLSHPLHPCGILCERFQQCLMVVNTLILHPTMLLILFKSRKTMHRGIFWGYVFTETVLAIGVVAEIPFFFFLQVSMHQSIIAELNPQWRLSVRTKRIFVSTFAVVLIINVLGFAFCGRESHDPERFYKYPELEWMRNQRGSLVVFGDFGQSEQFGTVNLVQSNPRDDEENVQGLLIADSFLTQPLSVLSCVHHKKQLRKENSELDQRNG
ncbi:hypothetical protein PRIPAC_79584 [Pristionchus pacificus]|uniref:Uncharacterized protein n=1 Tax=Pristionchus pacificus TaxID=54126 RepID=A0A2A6C4D9_PRIPA|nr:hypothetical protein PRIPAC_79584 [Pristionchus pacificus]|eukprot:PDM72986.1 hypothetical protein PRIPAC_39420 [Pristionchus pacificus]